MQWFLDFDDTLALGPMTWAFSHVVPKMIEQYKLPYDPILFNKAALESQRLGNDTNVDADALLEDFFKTIQWPMSLKKEFLDDIFTGYRPVLFDDAKPFLERISADKSEAYIISNNDMAPMLVQQLGIGNYFSAVLTPKSCGDLRGKPQRDMWEYATSQHSIQSGEQTAFVGDDPWSDGSFAESCNVSCWIVDRLGRYKDLYQASNYRFVPSLNEIKNGNP